MLPFQLALASGFEVFWYCGALLLFCDVVETGNEQKLCKTLQPQASSIRPIQEITLSQYKQAG